MHPTNINPLTAFKRDTKAFLKRLRATGEPEVLTIDGRGALVVMDIAAFRKLMAEIERIDDVAAIRAGLADVDAGRTRPVDVLVAELRKKYGLPDTS